MNLIFHEIFCERQKDLLFSDDASQVLKFWYKITVADFLILNITALFITSAQFPQKFLVMFLYLLKKSTFKVHKSN